MQGSTLLNGTLAVCTSAPILTTCRLAAASFHSHILQIETLAFYSLSFRGFVHGVLTVVDPLRFLMETCDI